MQNLYLCVAFFLPTVLVLIDLFVFVKKKIMNILKILF